jgi:hypothetical protein
MSDPTDAYIRALRELTLPYSQNVPPLPTQLACYSAVSGAIAHQLLAPCADVRARRQVSMPTLMTMPEASVNEDSHLFDGPDEVGVSSHSAVPTPPFQMRFSQ